MSAFHFTLTADFGCGAFRLDLTDVIKLLLFIMNGKSRILIAVLMLCAPVHFSPAQNATTAESNKAAAIRRTTDEVLSEVSRLRKLPILTSVASGASDKQAIERMIIENLNRQTTPQDLRADEIALKRWGLVADDFNYRTLIINLLTEQVAGYYDSRAQRFYVAEWLDIEAQRPVMAHELTHALQDQHFNLRRFQEWKKGDADAELAAASLVEGDATLITEQYVQADAARAFAFLRAMLSDFNTANKHLEAAPSAIRRTLTFPYEQGLSFAREVWKRGGWELVSQAYRELPASTEQVLHPAKYFAREKFATLTLPNYAAQFGRGWRQIDVDTNGEWSLYLIVDEYLKDDAVSRRAAEGWNGDRYAVYEHPATRQTAIINFTEWDTETDAQEFFAAYVARTAKRYERGTAQQNLSDKHTERYTVRHQPTAANVLIERQGTRVRIMESTGQSPVLRLFGTTRNRRK